MGGSRSDGIHEANGNVRLGHVRVGRERQVESITQSQGDSQAAIE